VLAAAERRAYPPLDEIDRVVHEAGTVRPRRRWWRSSLLVVLVPLCAGTVAMAASSGILSGEPIKNPSGERPSPKRGVGVNVDQGRVLAVAAADPAGGPPWGLRLVKTSRKVGCVELGRLVDGKLGVLGRDHAFADDGKFHERPAQVIDPTNCQQLDAAGNAFIAVSYIGIPDSADGRACASRKGGGDQRPTCPRESLRDAFYGLLGPEATAITYLDSGGRVVRQPVSGPEGAYAVVLKTSPARRGVGQWSVATTPGGGLRSVEYRDGTVCRIAGLHRVHGVRRCPLKGYVAPKLSRVTRAELATQISVTVGTRREHPGPKVKGRTFPAQRRITVRFRARVASDTRSYYTVSTTWETHPGEGCPNSAGPIARDVRAGTVVSWTGYLPFKCRGTVSVGVGFAQHSKPARELFDIGRFGRAEVGSARVRLP
jgi:hypothetical protein